MPIYKTIALTVAALAAISMSADENTGITAQDFLYLFHLYYDNSQLLADRDFEFKYDVIAAPYEPAEVSTEFPYRGEIFNFAGEVAANFVFDPKSGDVHFVRGKVQVRAPYVADGERAVFYDSQNSPILTIRVSESSFCNDDGICNADRGEDSLSCPKDCKQAVPVPPSPEPESEGTGDSQGLVTGLLYTFAGLGLIGGLWWFFRKRRAAPPSTPIPPPGPQNTVQ